MSINYGHLSIIYGHVISEKKRFFQPSESHRVVRVDSFNILAEITYTFQLLAAIRSHTPKLALEVPRNIRFLLEMIDFHEFE